MRKISLNSISMHDDNFKPSNHINALKQNLLVIHSDILGILNERNRGEIQELEGSISKLKDNNLTHMKELEKASLSSEETELYTNFNKQYPTKDTHLSGGIVVLFYRVIYG